VEILSNVQNVKSRCANVKPPYSEDFWRRFWFKAHMLSRDRLVVTCVRFLAVWKGHKRANREPWADPGFLWGGGFKDEFIRMTA